MTTVGIDVGAKNLVVAIRHKNTIEKVKEFTNNTVGHQAIIKLCSKYHKYGKVRIAIEATGSYHFDLALTLDNNTNNEVIVANPRATYAFAQANMTRCKTDKVDAEILALFAEKIDTPLWKKPSDNAVKLRYFVRTISSSTVDKTKAKNYLHALQSCLECPKELIKSMQQKIQFLEQEIEHMKKFALFLVKQDEQLNQYFNLILSIKGFGELSGLQLLAEVITIPEGLTHKQWVALAGLDPRREQSGISINKKTRVSKAGNRHLRKALFMPALSASKNDSYVKGYFNHMIKDRKLTKLQAIVAIMRKLVHAIHGMLHTLKPFDNTRFFKEPAMS